MSLEPAKSVQGGRRGSLLEVVGMLLITTFDSKSRKLCIESHKFNRKQADPTKLVGSTVGPQ